MAACTVSWKSHPHMMDAMAKDTLFLIAPGFEDPKHPGVRFVCPHCNQIEGLLAAFPDLAAGIDVHRVGFQRPREAVIAVVGEENQSLPLFIFCLLYTSPSPRDS